ncbi:hypothetical protein, partial [Agromyces seonyuensis]
MGAAATPGRSGALRRPAQPDLDALPPLLARLQAAGAPTAPHVAAVVAAALAGDGEAIDEAIRGLRPAQRLGREALPDPLPCGPAVEAAVGGLGRALSPWERRVLLAASVAVVDRIDAILLALGLTMADVVGSPVSGCLRLTAGRFAFVDPRLRCWAHDSASVAERTEVHALLADAYARLGDEPRAVWHRALATLEGDPALVEPLLALAEAADEAGDAEWAHAVAREAESHADGVPTARAALVAGVAALHGGLVDDAVVWLGEAALDPVARERALPLLLHASALRTGLVADAELDERLEAGPPPSAAALARACADAARHHA